MFGVVTTMPVPTHDATCKTTAFPITCWFCHADIFYFCCSHGSEVLFDMLGPPWPRHFDNCIGQKILNVQSASNLSVAEVEDLVKTDARSRGTFVPSNVQNIFRALKYQETGTPTILPLTPGTEEKEFTGTVRDINPNVNVLKQLDAMDSLMGRSLVKGLLTERHGLIHVRGSVNPSNGLCPQIEAFIPRSMLERAKVARFGSVMVRLAPQVLAGVRRFWVVKRITTIMQ
jgi:hypothetical protein